MALNLGEILRDRAAQLNGITQANFTLTIKWFTFFNTLNLTAFAVLAVEEIESKMQILFSLFFVVQNILGLLALIFVRQILARDETYQNEYNGFLTTQVENGEILSKHIIPFKVYTSLVLMMGIAIVLYLFFWIYNILAHP